MRKMLFGKIDLVIYVPQRSAWPKLNGKQTNKQTNKQSHQQFDNGIISSVREIELHEIEYCWILT